VPSPERASSAYATLGVTVSAENDAAGAVILTKGSTVVGKRRLGLETGSSSSSSLVPAVAYSGGLPSKVRDGVAPGGFSGSPYLVSSA
jgi:hypothetical protein